MEQDTEVDTVEKTVKSFSTMTDLQAKFGTYRATACEWPTGIENNNLVFCGGKLQAPHSYCAEHMKMAYRQVPKKEAKNEAKAFENQVKKEIDNKEDPEWEL